MLSGVHFFSSEASSQFTNGATVQKISYSSEDRTTADYTYKSVGGRLNKVTSQSTALGALRGVPLYYWNEESNQQTRISWSGSVLQMTGYQENNYFKMVNPPKNFVVTKRNARCLTPRVVMSVSTVRVGADCASIQTRWVAMGCLKSLMSRCDWKHFEMSDRVVFKIRDGEKQSDLEKRG